ncbi:MAG TPA: CRISPR-associated helicase Cas3', partial [Deltaproteobacteria bacterium]|nr:CRISPR-associated helicase Cas3' [Deltaproteobacteria bacterium]
MNAPNSLPLAHVRPREDKNFTEDDLHLLKAHLRDTASRAQSHAESFGCGDWAFLAGLWHDLGKYHDAFQRRIRTESGYDPEAHLEGQSNRVNHSTAGALHALEKLGKMGQVLTYCIAGHHAGLANWDGNEAHRGLSERLEQEKHLLPETLKADIPDTILEASPPQSRPPKGADVAFWIRMLFSCLVDADFLDTERFMDEEKFQKRSVYPALKDLLPVFEQYMTDTVLAQAKDTSVNRIRREVLEQCHKAAEQEPGFFSLTVPTGGGKTLSSLAFALRHAVEYKKQRIIYVIPYTSIIEQTVDEFRKIFGDTVLEHHSNLDSKKETAHSRLAAENWDAPLIVTTSVQFFESLYANRTSRCRKLYNLVNSVVILDEAQLLPPDFLDPCLHSLRELKNHYGASIVLCTATQPALEPRSGFDFDFKGLGEKPKEIVADPQQLQQRLRRVRFRIPADLNQPTSWEELAEELSQHEQVLCIVNKARTDCRELHALMSEGTLHLSGLMCGQHRSDKISEIKQRLKNKEPVRVISTQLVEAGVDVDFPVVYRALAGLDSVAQAAGRCNREGELPRLGEVVVFVPPSKPPISLRAATDLGKECLQTAPDDPLGLKGFTYYFEQLYWRKSLDTQQILSLHLMPNSEWAFAFRSATEKFRLIPDDTEALLVSYKNDNLLKQLKPEKADRRLLRKLQRYTVNVYP